MSLLLIKNYINVFYFKFNNKEFKLVKADRIANVDISTKPFKLLIIINNIKIYIL